MRAAELVQERVYENWQYVQDELIRVIGPLTDEQLRLRPLPELRSLGEIAEHIVRARALWVPRSLREGSVDPADLARMEAMANWDEPDDPTRTAAEVVEGLEFTWKIMVARLADWRIDDGRDTFPEDEVKQIGIIWGMKEHDIHHGGELSFALGAYGLSGLDL